MTNGDPYSVTKLAHHPDQLAAFRAGQILAPVQIHLMPQNLCNHDCSFCSYRISNWKNSEQFDDKEQIPWPLLQRTLREARALGTKAIELTGGGEPMIYGHVDGLLELIRELGFDLGLVTNGTAVTKARADFIGAMPAWKWVRVSIDAGRRSTYEKVRAVGPGHWDRAWLAVQMLAEERDRRAMQGDREIRVGTGFVVTNENYDEVYEFCRIAKRYRADNVRLSVRFGPGGNGYYAPGTLARAEEQARAAEAEFNDDDFAVHNLIGERVLNQTATVQDYEPCYTMRLLCVIGGDAKVYSCCTLAFNPSGELGDLRKEPFTELWARQQRTRFEGFQVRDRCRCQCLYERRNRAMIEMVDSGQMPAADAAQPHRNFV